MDRTYWSACAAAFMTVSSYTVLLGALPYTLQQNGHSPVAVGSVLAGFPVGIVVLRAISLRFVDRTPWRAAMTAGALVSLVSIAATWFAASSPWVAAARLLHGAGFALLTTSAMACVGARAPLERRGALLGIYSAIGGLSMVIFPPAGLWLAQHVGLIGALLAAAVFATIAFGAANLVRGDEQPWPEPATRDLAGPPAGLILGLALCAVPLGVLESTLPFLAAPRGLVNLPLIYLVWGAAVVVGRMAGGALADRPRIAAAPTVAMIAAICGLLIAATWRGEAIFLLACVAGGVGIGTATSMLTAALSRAAPSHAQGRALGLGALLYNVMFAIGAPLGGWAFHAIPVGPLWVAAAVLSLACLLALQRARVFTAAAP